MLLFKGKKLYIFLLVIIVIGGLGYRQYRKSNDPLAYEMAAVVRGDIKQTVEATGKIESTDDVSLRFDAPGTIAAILVKAGANVKAGAWLANIRLGELSAAAKQAQANLDQKLAGASEADRKYYAAAVSSAEAAWEQSKIDAEKAAQAAESALETAKNNLKLAAGGNNSQIVNQAYANALTTLQGTLAKLDDALSQADNILGIDNVLANDAFQDFLSTLDGSKLSAANATYFVARSARDQARGAIIPLSLLSEHVQIDAAFPLAEDSLVKMNTLLSSVSDVLKATQAIGTLTAASLDTKKTTIETSRTTITTQYNTVLTQKQALSDAKNSFSTYSIAYAKAQRDLEQAKANAITTVQIKEAAKVQAEATYDSKVNPPREVDVAALRAAFQLALAAQDKGIIRAPFDGAVTKINKKVGEAVSTADVILEMLSPHFEIQVDIPETDVAKLLTLGDKPVEFTVDALGDDKKFPGQINQIDKSSTEIQDVVYYRVRIAVASSTSEQLFKSGMTANVKIKTDSRQQALVAPLRAIRTRADGTKFVKVLSNGGEVDKSVKLGLRGDDSRVEVIEGLVEGEKVVVNVKR